jgi:hemerythrin
LQSTWLFGEQVSFPTQNKVAQLMYKEIFAKDDEISQQDGSNLYILNKGEVKIYSENKLIQTLSQGKFFGEEKILHQSSHLFKAKVVKQSEIFVIPGKILSNIPVVSWKLLETFEKRMKILGTHFIFEWKEDYSVNIKNIDQQHQILFGMINNLYRYVDDQNIKQIIDDKITGLMNILNRHFDYEEQLMTQYQYTDFSQQKKEHQAIVEEVNTFQTDFDENDRNGLLDFLDILKEHLIRHTLIEDRKYSSFFNKRGVF